MLGRIVFISCPGQSSLRAKESGQGWRTEPNNSEFPGYFYNETKRRLQVGPYRRSFDKGFCGSTFRRMFSSLFHFFAAILEYGSFSSE
jgi:hypothetical protein